MADGVMTIAGGIIGGGRGGGVEGDNGETGSV